jgi:putative transposase
MPAKNSIKQYVENSYYHIYNRGVEKRQIFMNEQDYGVFLSYLKEYLLLKDEDGLRKRLSDPNISSLERSRILRTLGLNNFAGEITLLAYCLMPNHFHFFIKQKSEVSIDKFMQSLCTRYTMYFNKKYKRVGSLFQGVYKAVLVTSDPQFLHLSRYIHKQALALQGETLQAQPCSYPEYLGKRNTEWVHPEEVLASFSKTNHSLSYEAFVGEEEDLALIRDIILEEDL